VTDPGSLPRAHAATPAGKPPARALGIPFGAAKRAGGRPFPGPLRLTGTRQLTGG
jgi:hypothetical protein